MTLTIGYLCRTVIEYLLAILILLSGLIGLFVTKRGAEPGIVAAYQLWILAALLVAVGSAQFVLFMRKNPLMEEYPHEING